jgi:hypothetical protein
MNIDLLIINEFYYFIEQLLLRFRLANVWTDFEEVFAHSLPDLPIEVLTESFDFW